MQRAHLLRQLVLDSHYVIDEREVAAAILARVQARRLLADAGFRNDPPFERSTPRVRSFRPTTQVRSFRPCPFSSHRTRSRAQTALSA